MSTTLNQIEMAILNVPVAANSSHNSINQQPLLPLHNKNLYGEKTNFIFAVKQIMNTLSDDDMKALDSQDKRNSFLD